MEKRYEWDKMEQQISDIEAKLKALQNGIIDDETLNMLVKEHKLYKDLEAKLAESEKQIKGAREAGNMAVDSWCKNRRKYEAQIAEMQNKSFILYSMLYETLEKQGCDNVASQIDQMTGWTYDKEADWLKGNRNYDQLKQQLAECEKKFIVANNLRKNTDEVLLNYKTEKYGLDKTIQELRKMKLSLPEKEWYYKGFENCERQMSSHIADLTLEVKQLKQQLAEKEKEISEYIKIVDDLHKQLSDKCDFCDKTKDQDKISFAVEQLEKVKEEMDLRPRGVSKGWKNKEYDTLVEEDVYEVIDNQIKQLKEGK